MAILERLLRYAAVICSALLLLGFAFFAYDQGKSDSDRNAAKVEGISEPDPGPQSERLREKQHTKVREAIDDANDWLLKPFAGIVHSGDVWVNRIVPTLLALLLFGFGLGYLARTINTRS